MAVSINQHSLVSLWHWVNHHWLITLFSIASVGLIIASILRIFTYNSPTGVEGGLSWNQITPGVSRVQDLQSLGNPVAVQETGVGRKFSYTSDYPAIPDIVFADPQGVVQIIKEQVVYSESNTVDVYVKKYGSPDLELYASYIDRDVKAFIFLDEGLVLIAAENTRVIEEKWYFTPTDQDTFLRTWGVSFTTEPGTPEQFGFQ